MDATLLTSSASIENFPWLSLIVLLPAIGALILQFLPNDSESNFVDFRNCAIIFLSADFLIILLVLSKLFDNKESGLQLIERVNWLPAIGLEWSLGIDGISAPLVALSGLITLLAATASWKITNKPKLYFSLLLIQASAQCLVFLSQDFLLFFLAWELELVPVYLLIAIWGGKRRLYAATKFILYTALASLLILISGLALALSGNDFSLNLTELATRSTSGTFGLLLSLIHI